MYLQCIIMRVERVHEKQGNTTSIFGIEMLPKDKKKGKLSYRVRTEINKTFEKKGIKDHLNLDDDEVKKCQAVADFNNRPENKE